MDFDRAFDLLISHEGGFVHRPFTDDPGGATKYGITEKVARANGYIGAMQDLTLDFSKSVYRKQYWDACQCDAMPDSIRYPLFDAAVNSGAGQAIKWLQASVGVKADGVIGPMTRQSVNMAAPQVVRQKMIGARLRFMTNLSNWTANAKGWSRRIAAILEM
jgi:lysozyme family protein